MKSWIKEFIGVLIGAISLLLIVIGSYIVIINIKHYSIVNETARLSDEELFQEYKNNVLILEDNFDGKYSLCLDSLKNGGVFRLMPKNLITYRELYELNEYFINEVINNCWAKTIAQDPNIIKDSVEKDIKILVNNALYIKEKMLNNSNYYYTFKKERIIDDDYQYILNNYNAFSKVLLKIGDKYDSIN